MSTVQISAAGIVERRDTGGKIAATIVAAAAFALSIGMLYVNLFVVPRYKKIFQDFGTSLPGGARLIVGASDATVALWFLVVPLLLLLFVGLAVWIWRLDWRSGLVASILLAILLIVYGLCTAVFLYLPLLSLITSVRGSSGP